MRIVLDASAAIAFLRSEPGAARVREVLLDTAKHVIDIHAVNLIEVQYRLASFGGEKAAEEAVGDFLKLGVRVHEDIPRNHCCPKTTRTMTTG